MTKRDIKMIGLDLDGTLLNSKKELTEYSKEVIMEAIRQGVTVLPATGRPLCGIPEEVRKIPGVRYALTANGARVIDIQEDKILYERLMDFEDGRKVMDVFRKYDVFLEAYLDGVGYAEKNALEQIQRFMPISAMAKYLVRTRRPVEDVYEFYCRERREPDKIQALFANLDEKEIALAEAKKQAPEVEYTGAIFNNIEVNGKDARKGIALVNLGKLLGISKDQIMACGDGTNDTEMIREVGFGVAMANAVDEVKQVADYVTLSNDEDGVAKAIEKYVLK